MYAILPLRECLTPLLPACWLPRHEYGYRRDRAAATLTILAKDAEIRALLQAQALSPLKAMFLDTDDRWEKRDSATALLRLFSQASALRRENDRPPYEWCANGDKTECGLVQDELGEEVKVSELFRYWWCSRAWLVGQAQQPDAEYTDEEVAARTNLPFWQASHTPESMDQLITHDLEWVAAVQGREELGAEDLEEGEGAAVNE